MKIINISDYIKSGGTRMLAKQIKNKMTNPDEIYKLNFKKIDVISNCFADELIGKLVQEKGYDYIKEHIRFAETNDEVKIILKNAIKEHMM